MHESWAQVGSGSKAEACRRKERLGPTDVVAVSAPARGIVGQDKAIRLKIYIGTMKVSGG